MTDEPTPDLSETLEQIAEQAKPVDLSKAVAQKVRSLRRRRNATGGAAAVLALAIVGGGGYGLTRTTGSSSANAPLGGVAVPSTASPAPQVGTTAIAEAVPAAQPTPVAPSSGIVTGAPGTTTLPVLPSPTLSALSVPSPTTTPQRTGPGPTPTTPPPGTPTPTLRPPTPLVSSTPTSPPAATTPAAPLTATSATPKPTPLPCTVLDNFGPGPAGALVITDAMKARARAMGDKLCELVGGGARYNIEEWISIGGLSGLFNGLTYDVQAHLTGAGAGPVNNEAWLAVYQAPAGSKPTFKDGTLITLQTDLATSLKAKIEVEGGPFDAFAGG